MRHLTYETSRPTPEPSDYRPGGRCEPNPVLIVATAIALVASLIVVVVIVPVGVSVLLLGTPESPMPFLPLSVTTGHLVRSGDDSVKP